ncbi:Nucleic-acid-binding protein from transposon X-element [Formica fusca]
MPKRIANKIETKNRFALLEDEEQEDDKMEAENTDNEGNNIQEIKQRKPPPLVIHGCVQDHAAFVQLIKQSVENNFYIKYHENNVEVFLSNYRDYEALSQTWKNKEVKFHTYTAKDEKRRTYVLKGLHELVKPEEIKENLKELGITVHNINLMKGTRKPMFMVSVTTIKLNVLKQKAQFLCYTRVEWDNYINKRRIAQCHRCQEWGHATINCHADPVCLKCAGEHLTKDCKKPRSEPAKCINCDKDHPANATICEAYKRRLAWIGMEQDRIKSRSKEPRRQRKEVGLDNLKQFPKLGVEPDDGHGKSWINNNKNRSISYSQRVKGMRKDFEENNNGNKGDNELKDLLTLLREFKKLNAKCNIRRMLELVRSLNEQLDKCINQIEKFQVFVEFCQTLEEQTCVI